MSIRIPQFVTDIYQEDKDYTPQEIIDYISKTTSEDLADPQDISFLKMQSRAKVEKIIEKYKLKEDQKLKKSSSEAGNELATILRAHAGETIMLIQKGASRKGIWV